MQWNRWTFQSPRPTSLRWNKPAATEQRRGERGWTHGLWTWVWPRRLSRNRLTWFQSVLPDNYHICIIIKHINRDVITFFRLIIFMMKLFLIVSYFWVLKLLYFSKAKNTPKKTKNSGVSSFQHDGVLSDTSCIHPWGTKFSLLLVSWWALRNPD